MHRLRFLIQLVIIGAAVGSGILFSPRLAYAKIPPCIEENSCTTFTMGINTIQGTADGYVAQVRANDTSYEVYGCIGPDPITSTCASMLYNNPQYFTFLAACHTVTCTVTTTGLRSGRTYHVRLVGVSSPDLYGDDDVVTTWPGAPIAPNVTVGPFTASLGLTTPFTSTSELFYDEAAPRWTMETSGLVGADIVSVSALSDGTAWAVGGLPSAILKRSSSGSWAVQASSTNEALYAVDAFNDTSAWAGGNNGVVIRTTDGSTWTAVSGSGLSIVNGVEGAMPNTVWAVGPAKIMFYNGAWSQKWNDASKVFTDVATINDREIWVVGSGGTILHSVDRGLTWPAMTSPTPQMLTSISTIDGNVVYIGTSGGQLYRWDRGPNVWTAISTGINQAIENISQVGPDELWFSTGTVIGRYRASATPQVTRYNEPSAMIVTSVNGVAAASGNQAFAIGQGGKVVRYALTTGTYVSDPAAQSHTFNLAGLNPNTTYNISLSSAGSGVVNGYLGSFTTQQIDIVDPTINFSTPASSPAYTNNSAYTVDGSATDNVSVTDVTMTQNGTPLGVVSSGTNITPLPFSKTVTLTGGQNTFVATARDSSNNTASATATVVYDTTAPTVAINDPSPVTTSPFTLTGTAQDDNRVQSAEISINGGPRLGLGVTPGATVNWSFSVVPQAGPNTVTVFAKDAAGNEGSATRTFTYTPPSFSIVANPPSNKTAYVGDTVAYDLAVVPQNGFAGTVTLSVSSSAPGPTLSVPPTVTVSSPANEPFTLTVTTGAATPGNYSFTVVGTSGSLSSSTVVQLTLNPAQDFSLSIGPPVTITAGATAVYQVTASATSTFSGTITWSLTGQPAISTVSFAPATTTLAPSDVKATTLAIQTTSATAAGTYTLTITGASLKTHTTTTQLTINAAPEIHLSMAPASRTMTAGGSGVTFNGTLTTSGGFDADVTASAASAPADPNLTFIVMPVTQHLTDPATKQFALTVDATSAVPSGTYTVTVTATSSVDSDQTTIQVTVDADTTPPVISSIVAAPDYNNVRITWTTNEPADSEIRIYTDPSLDPAGFVGLLTDGGFCTAPAGSCHNLLYSPLNALTTYYFSVTSRDQAPTPNMAIATKQEDNVTPLQFTTLAEPDTEPPTVVITDPANGANVYGNIQIKGTATDNANVVLVKIKAVGQGTGFTAVDTSVGCSGTSCAFAQPWNTLSSPNDTYTITAIAQDASNSSLPATVIVTVANDLTDPVLQLMLCPGDPSGTKQYVCVEVSPGCASGGACDATVRWTTDDAATSEVEYDLSPVCGASCAYGAQILHDDADPNGTNPYRQNHQVTLSNLLPDRLYHYRISSCNVSGGCVH